MTDGWEQITEKETKRTADNLKTFILFCEDKISEPSYFKEFAKEYKVRISEAVDQKSSFKNIANTLEYCEKEGLLETDNKAYKIRSDVKTPIWCVFDRDVETNNPDNINHAKNIEFNLSIQSAESAGLNVAWSNDVFELWILLHFEDVTPNEWKHRTYIYDRLTAIFKALPDKSPELTALTELSTFNYKTFFKTEKNFNFHVLPRLAAGRADAIVRAQILEAAFIHTQKSHERNPCTMVHHLVSSIISAEKLA
ncbi:RloB-like protein [Chitinophaga sp. CF118]|uniref:RloB family protein n=1 Tax=Chitinophaga sp. CF118 TaxID=1884367 RepID=UPI0008EDC635|nr:RloB family protein [Chitinophaga sp. CF118]SFE11044.1 RloB-like protein [Chitinophaga sp. CF118]